MGPPYKIAKKIPLNEGKEAAVIFPMKTPASVVSAAAISLLLAACTSSGRPPHNTGAPVRSSSGNAQLEGTSADEVIWRSTQQWHADRWHERRQRR